MEAEKDRKIEKTGLLVIAGFMFLGDGYFICMAASNVCKKLEENITDENANCLPEWSSILSLVHRRAICSTEAIAG